MEHSPETTQYAGEHKAKQVRLCIYLTTPQVWSEVFSCYRIQLLLLRGTDFNIVRHLPFVMKDASRCHEHAPYD
jgi:hypothetical protein